MIITQPFRPFRSALNKLHINGNKVSESYYPLLIDTNSIKYTAGARDEIDATNQEKLKPFNFILFHPSRLFIEQKKNYVEMGVWKGNDNLFKGFAIFLKKYNITDACISMPERSHSPDILLAKQIITRLGIENNVVWLKPPSDEGFSRNELVKFYSLSNIVADEFATGWFGSIVVEGLACAKPTFCYVDEDVMKKLYPWHPIISVKEPEAIAEKIAEFYFDQETARAQGEISRKWAVEFHSLERGTNTYINNFQRDLREIFRLD